MLENGKSWAWMYIASCILLSIFLICFQFQFCDVGVQSGNQKKHHNTWRLSSKSLPSHALWDWQNYISKFRFHSDLKIQSDLNQLSIWVSQTWIRLEKLYPVLALSLYESPSLYVCRYLNLEYFIIFRKLIVHLID